MKEFTYRGATLEELKSMSIEKFSSLLPSRERRSLLRQAEFIKKFLARCEKNSEKGKVCRTHFRHLVIVPKMIGLKIGVYSGKEFVSFEITPEMLGHRLGEFVMTRGKVEHGSPGIGATRSSSFLSVK